MKEEKGHRNVDVWMLEVWIIQQQSGLTVSVQCLCQDVSPQILTANEET